MIIDNLYVVWQTIAENTKKKAGKMSIVHSSIMYYVK